MLHINSGPNWGCDTMIAHSIAQKTFRHEEGPSQPSTHLPALLLALPEPAPSNSNSSSIIFQKARLSQCGRPTWRQLASLFDLSLVKSIKKLGPEMTSGSNGHSSSQSTSVPLNLASPEAYFTSLDSRHRQPSNKGNRRSLSGQNPGSTWLEATSVLSVL